ncbi:hypothetical protein SBOR_0808 [Sclerotinia borealis F-4128]|uniref:3'-5' exonuclease domain-containing protein n=1 Tax=Sclerotinia borealis (strain F-4128) TaxID=1432307 RepID=W9CW25_SCLBF|nr:hypothetical protein SBOR_0808 [Sclerotinia borealis F-4128]
MKNMSSFVGKSNLVSVEAMGSAIAGMSGKRASPSVTRSISSKPSRTWHPSHGIVFKDASAPVSPRLLSTTAVADHEQNLEQHSHVEDGYVLANSHVDDLKTQKVATVAPEETLKSDVAVDSVEEAAAREMARELQEIEERKDLPISDSTYKMTEELFRKAKEAEPETPASYWSHTLYRGPNENGIPKKVKVHYCRTLQTTERTLQQYFLGKKVLGFDIEWKSDARPTAGAKHNVSLVQMATEERVGLFHLALFPTWYEPELVAPTMKKIMEDPEVTKLGVAISADCTRLRKYLGINSVSIFELSHLHRLVKYTLSQEHDLINKRLVSLAKQTEEHLHLPLFKGGDVRASDWSRELSIQQIAYAASDSYAGYHIYDILETKRQALNPVPPRPYHADKNQPILTATPTKKIYTRRKPIQDSLPLDPESSLQNEPILETAAEIEEVPISVNPDVPPKGSEPPSGTPPGLENEEKIPTNLEKANIDLVADIFVTFHCEANPLSKIPKQKLKAYFVWYHNPHLAIPQITEMLPDKKLVITTVKYILDVISEDASQFPFDNDRLRELLEQLPKGVAWTKYRRLVEAVDGSVTW